MSTQAAVQRYGAPCCRCSTNRNTEHVGTLAWYCHDCKNVYHYRLRDGLLVPLTRIAALALDARRANGERL